MGYYMDQKSCDDFLIKKENFDRALAAIKNLAGKGTYPGPDGRHYSWVTESEYIKATTLKDAMLAWRWSLGFNTNGDADRICFEGEKLGDDEILLKAIAPFVEHGELEMLGEDGATWKWVFKQGQLFEFVGRVVYDGEET